LVAWDFFDAGVRCGDGMFDTALCGFSKFPLCSVTQTIGCVPSRTCCPTHCVQVLLHVWLRLGGLHEVCAFLMVNLWMWPLYCCLSRLPCLQDLGPLLHVVKLLLQLMQAICHVDRARCWLNLLLVPLLLLMMLLLLGNWSRPGRRRGASSENGCLRWCHLRLHGAIDTGKTWSAKALPAHALPAVGARRIAHRVLVKLAVAVATEETLNARASSIGARPMTEAIVGAQGIGTIGAEEANRADARAGVALSAWRPACLGALGSDVA